ncbi:MAG: tyrosine-type recombinase/integrase [Gammaproteobacteria bacterium]|jgi:hypothetical protein|nr:tyrosine-type recombinase/integrase [Gammaproteobacteria bacterium]
MSDTSEKAQAHHCCGGQHAGSGDGDNRYDKVPPGYEGTVYVCPMCEPVRQTEPGACPMCGMALEPEGVVPGEEDQSELRDMTRRFWVSAAFTLPLFVFAMGEMLPGQPFHDLLAPRLSQWLQLALATPVVLWGGWPFLVRGVQSVRTMNLNMFTLIGLGVSVAYGFSVVATLAPALFPASFRGPEGRVGVYFEAAAVITTLVLLGQVLELRARRATSGALRSLLKIRRDMGFAEADDAPLIVSRNHRGLSVRSFQARMRKWCQSAGLPVHATPHWFRHTLAMRLMRNSTAADPRGVVQGALGHRDINSTAVYTRPSREDVDRAMQEVAS